MSVYACVCVAQCRLHHFLSYTHELSRSELDVFNWFVSLVTFNSNYVLYVCVCKLRNWNIERKEGWRKDNGEWNRYQWTYVGIRSNRRKWPLSTFFSFFFVVPTSHTNAHAYHTDAFPLIEKIFPIFINKAIQLKNTKKKRETELKWEILCVMSMRWFEFQMIFDRGRLKGMKRSSPMHFFLFFFFFLGSSVFSAEGIRCDTCCMKISIV